MNITVVATCATLLLGACAGAKPANTQPLKPGASNYWEVVFAECEALGYRPKTPELTACVDRLDTTKYAHRYAPEGAPISLSQTPPPKPQPSAQAPAAVSVQEECRVVPSSPYDDPRLLRQMATIYLKHGLSEGTDFLQRASNAQQEIDLQERACALCANAGLANGSLERSNCVADQVAKHRRPERADPSPGFRQKSSVTCRKNVLGDVTCTED